MAVVAGVLGLRDNHAAHLVAVERVTDAGLALILLAAQGHHDIIATGGSRLLDTRQDRREIIMGELRHDDANHLLRHHPTVAQGLTDGIRIEIMFARIRLDCPPPLLADTG